MAWRIIVGADQASARLGLVFVIQIMVLWALSGGAKAATLEGLVLSAKGPVSTPRVFAYRDFGDVVAKRPAYLSTPGDAPGTFRLVLPAGSFYLTASGTDGAQPLFSYHGANPVVVDDADLWIPFMALPRVGAREAPLTMARLRGQVTYRGAPVSGAQVSLYTVHDGPFRGIGQMSASTATDGSFEFQADEGEYVVVARKRVGGGGMKPLGAGDLFCYCSANPVAVPPKKAVLVELPCYPKQDLRGFLSEGAFQAMKRVRPGLARFRERNDVVLRDGLIRGRVVDLADRPRGALYVMAYAVPARSRFRMNQLRDRPAFITETGANGSFRLKVDAGRRFAIVARERPGASPEPGEYYGLYEGEHSHSVDATSDGGSERVIVVSRVMEADETKELGVAPAPMKPGPLADVVLHDDTSWRGEMNVAGTVVVGRGATLHIEPGTVVRFKRLDLDGDGVGDAGLRVLGRLLVKGTPAAPVRFMSAEETPRPADWSHILVFTARGQSIIEHALIEHAFTGLQVHFSAALIRDSSLRGNVEGLRFGRAFVHVERNDITGNRYGIRQHRVERGITIVDNRITENEVGLFLIPSGQNTLDFSAERYVVDERFRAAPRVRGNTFAGNRRYDFQLGERFRYDIDVTGNWWGTSDSDEIEGHIHHNADDRSLGRVLFEPALERPAETAPKGRSTHE